MYRILKILLLVSVLWACSAAKAQQIVTLVYPWTLGDSMAGIMMTMLEEANSQQTRYRFLIESRPGAGSAIAANHVIRTPNTILSTGASVWLRPIFYPGESHDPQKLRTLMVQFECPFAVTSGRYAAWSQVPRDQNLTIGTSGLGVVTHLTALQIQAQYPRLSVIPFRSTIEALQNAAGQHVDFHVGFVRQAEEFVGKSPGVTVLGVTGTRRVKDFAPLVTQGFPQILSEISLTHFLMVSHTTDAKLAQEWSGILRQAMQSDRVKQMYGQDHCQSLTHVRDTQAWDQRQITMWRNLTRNMPPL
jgi:tripartite-type tricarboxylate transporter receptor subunit TctC